MQNLTFPTIITHKEWLTSNTCLLKFQFKHPHTFDYTAGQFISIIFPAGSPDQRPQRRSYSIAGLQKNTLQSTEIEIVATIIPNGLASQFFIESEVGSETTISGPYGALVLPKTLPKRLFLIATSTGVAPYRAFLPQLENLLRENESLEIELIFGVRKRKDAFFINDFKQMSDKYPRFQFNLCFSRHDNSILAPYEHACYVQERMENLAPDPDKDLIFLCGNPAMIDSSFTRLTENGFSPRQIKREKYLPTKK